MKNKKFISIASSLGLSVGLLTGCGIDDSDKKGKDDDSHARSGSGGGGVFVGGNNAKSSKGVVRGGSKGIGTAKGGGATS